MAVGVQGGLDALVTQPLLQELGGYVHFDERRCVAVAKIVHPDLLDP